MWLDFIERDEQELYETKVHNLTKSIEFQIKDLIDEKDYQGIVLLGIGSQHFNFDTFGPRVISLIRKYDLPEFVEYFGTIEEPLNALNIEEFVEENKTKLSDNLVIAIDAAVAYIIKLGEIKVLNYGINPGLGFGKNINAVGDFSIIAATVKQPNKFTRNINSLAINNNKLEKLINITAESLYVALSKENFITNKKKVMHR